MKQIYSAAAVLFMASQLAAPLRAEPEHRMRDPQKMEENIEKREEKMLENMTKKLSLSTEQQKSLKAVLDQQGEKMKAARLEMMEKHKALREETDAAIVKLLNDDQKKKFEEWKTQRQEHFKNRKERRDQRKPE